MIALHEAPEFRGAEITYELEGNAQLVEVSLEGVSVGEDTESETRLRQDEVMVVQLVLGPRRAPVFVPAKPESPQTRWWQVALGLQRMASGDERRSLQVRAEQASFAATLRLGAAGVGAERTRRLGVAMQSALAVARGSGVRIEFIRERPGALNQPLLPRSWPLELSCSELVGLLGWPLGADELPGVEPLHPLALRASGKVETTERAFARSDVPGDDRLIGISSKDMLMHFASYGPSGSGKSTLALAQIEADMQAGRPLAVLDPKRQLIDDVLARVPAHRRDDIVVLDPTAAHPVGYNPLDVARRDPDVVVDGILAVFAGLFREGWGPRTADIIGALLRSAARTAAATGRQATLADLPRIVADPQLQRQVRAHVAHDEGLASFWGWWDDQSPQAQAAALAAPMNKLRQLLMRPALMRMLDQRESRFNLRNIWRDNLILLCPLNEALVGAGTADLLGSLVVADLWTAVQERASEQHPEKRPGMVHVDEAPRFIHVGSLADSLAVSRSLGVAWGLHAQFRDQYPAALAKAIDMNARSKVVFATEYDDARHFARGEQRLTHADFQALERFQAYANVVADGHPQGWARVRTLPPSKPLQPAARMHAYSHRRWASPAPQADRTHETGSEASAASSGPAAGAPGAVEEPTGAPEIRVGRKRRRQT
jgi:hypothetical protein